MLILLPPSEGKAAPSRGKPLNLGALDFPELTEARESVLAALVELCSGTLEEDVADAARVLGLGSTQLEQVTRNAGLPTAPTTRADRIYTGVLYDALDLASLDASARRRATRWLVIMSSLFGAVRPADPIASYRLSGDTNLPGLGTISTYWRRHLGPVLSQAAGNGLVVDLRSSTYAGFWKPPAELAARVATMRVLHEVDGRRKVVSHFNKATKGRIVRALLADGGTPRTPADLADHLAGLGWTVEPQPATRTGQQLDVVVEEI
ncbi:MAG TPA: peroxide stress protein YaaA [Marmoricola sp.]|nr:peroxide stress protein YaaA [Marmoricola sp.]